MGVRDPPSTHCFKSHLENKLAYLHRIVYINLWLRYNKHARHVAFWFNDQQILISQHPERAII